ncbi:hypothetical protein G9A89_001968 [Geosiphon pyriformis]|nr:hypothetical protein G9A89_001968 [Geosiphon pyriformis]
MTTTRAKIKKVANSTFPIATNKVLTQEGFSIIEAARQNVLATFLLKNTSNKQPLVVSDLFSLSLASSSSPVKVPSKKHIRVSPSVVSTTSKSPKIFNNRPVNKLVFPVFTTFTTTSTTTALQMAAKAKISKKQQQAVATAMVTLNLFVVPDEIFSKIFTAAASFLPDMDDNNSSTSSKMGQDQPLAVLPDVILSSRSLPIPVAKQSINPDDLKDWADQMKMESTVSPPVSDAADGGAWENVNGCQRFSGWVASNLVPGATFKIKMALLKSLNSATKVAISDEVFLTTFKIARSSGVVSVSFLSLSIVLHDIPLGIFFDDIKTTLGIFGVVTSVKLKPVGLWQYAVVNFKNTSSIATTLSNWSVLIRKNSVRILPIVNQKEIISSRDAFKAKCQDLDHLTINCKKSPPHSPKLSSNTSDGPKIFKLLFARSKSYAKAAAFVVPPSAAAANMNLDLSGSPKTTSPMVPAVSSVPNSAVESRLASLESHLSELSVLIKSLVELVSVLVALVTKLLFTLSAVDGSVKKCVDELAKQNKELAAVATMMQKRITHLEKICEWTCLEDRSDVDNMVDDINNNDYEDKNFSVYDNIFDVMMHL